MSQIPPPRRTALLFSDSQGSRYVKLEPGMPFFSPDIKQMTSYLSSINTKSRDETTSDVTTMQSMRHLKTRDHDLRDDDICVVCQDDLHNKEKVETLKCVHKYHQKCLARWLVQKKLCPLCREEAWIKISVRNP